MTSPDLAAQELIDDLDSFYCHNHLVALWAAAVANRLEALGSTCSATKFPRLPSTLVRRHAAWADRIGDLGGAVTADPRPLIERAPGTNEFTIPDCSDPRAITSYALQRLDVIVTAHQAFLDKVRGRDDVSFALVVRLLGAETHRRADVLATLAGQGATA